MRRFLIVLVLFGAAILILRRLAGALAGGGRGATQRRSGRPERGSTELVRDRVCNTFLPKDRALELRASGEVRYFCSEQCRSRFLSGASRSDDAA